MTIRVRFWREVNSGGRVGHSDVRTYIIPQGFDDSDAVEAAKREFCRDLDVFDWTDAAHGYDVACHSDDRRMAPRPDDGHDFWARRIEITPLEE